MPSSWLKVVYTPPICITVRLPSVSRCFCRSSSVRRRWNTSHFRQSSGHPPGARGTTAGKTNRGLPAGVLEFPVAYSRKTDRKWRFCQDTRRVCPKTPGGPGVSETLCAFSYVTFCSLKVVQRHYFPHSPPILWPCGMFEEEKDIL